MGLFQEFKAFIHSITTDDHYASYDSRYRNGSSGGAPGLSRGDSGLVNNGSTSRLNEISRLNGSGHSFEQAAAAAKIGYRPGLRSQQDLPLQTFDENGQPPLPSIDSLWDRIERWMEEEYPELEDSLNDGVTTTDLNEFENDLGCGNLPEDFRQFYKRHDGQLRGGRPTGLFMGLALLDLEGIIEENAIWLKVAERLERQQYMVQHQQKEGTSSTASSRGSSVNNSFIGNQRSIPPNSIQPFYYQKGWVTLMKDHIGNQIALDLAPGPQGKWGQIIIFGRDFDTKLVIANSLTEFIFNFVTDLEQGNYQIDSSVVQEELGYLGRERNDDYMIGDEDEDEGELFFYDRDNKEFGKGARGKLSYIEVFKRRTLKKYGLTEKFSTQFTPQVKPTASAAPKSGTSSPLLNQSRNSSASNLKPGSTKPATSSPLVNSGQFSVPKETIIDNKTTAKSTPEIMVDDTDKAPEPEIEESKPEEVVKSKEEPKEESKEEPKEELKEEPKEEAQDVNNLV